MRFLLPWRAFTRRYFFTPLRRLARLPRIGYVLLAVNLLILLMPLAGVGLIRVYESALVRQTENSLVAQAAFVASLYRAELFKAWGSAVPPPGYGARPIGQDKLQMLGYEKGERWRPSPAILDLSEDLIHPMAVDAQSTRSVAHLSGRTAGDMLTPILKDAQVVTLASIRVTDAKGVIVATTSVDLGKSLAHRDEVLRALAGEEVRIMRQRQPVTPAPPLSSVSRGTDIRVHVASPILVDKQVVGTVLLSRTPANILQALWGKREVLLALALALLALVLLFSVATALTVSRPLRALIIQAQRAAEGERGAMRPLRYPMTREVAEVSEAVAQMAAILERRATYIRDFAAHVSHEFKTPLTAMRGSVELLQDHGEEMDQQDRQRFLQSLDDNIQRLDRLVRKLLELARADMNTARNDESCDVLPMLHGLADKGECSFSMNEEASSSEGEIWHGERAWHKEVGGGLDDIQLGDERLVLAERFSVVVAYRPEVGGESANVKELETLPVAIGCEALASVIDVLVQNSRQHGASEMLVKYEVIANVVILTFADNGPGISPGNRERIFEPFFTTARARGGTGMGLAIARSLVRSYGGSLQLQGGARKGNNGQSDGALAESAPLGSGAVFEVQLPLWRGAGEDRINQ